MAKGDINGSGIFGELVVVGRAPRPLRRWVLGWDEGRHDACVLVSLLIAHFLAWLYAYYTAPAFEQKNTKAPFIIMPFVVCRNMQYITVPFRIFL
jgi:hypothetical protein